MARLVLSDEEQQKMDEIIDHFGPDHPEVKRLVERVESFEVPDVLRFLHAAIHLHIETRLAITGMVNRARDLGMEPMESGVEEFHREAEMRPWVLHTNLPDSFLKRFEVAPWTAAEWARMDEWLLDHGLTFSERDRAAIALGITPEPGSNLFFDLLTEIEDEAEEMFFDDMSEKITKELLGS